jgi:2-dehydro-3-deoxygluconokinase
MASSSHARTPGRVVAFGEAMIRLTPPRNERLDRTISLDITIGGAELNVAVTVACLNTPVSYVTVLPDTGVGRNILRQARANNVDTRDLLIVPESVGRTGAYYLEEAADPRPSAVLYDRANSAFAKLEPGTFDWPEILEGAGALHICGITPAVGPGPRAETIKAMEVARGLGVPVFFDLNYRSKLWSEEDAKACFQEIIPHVDILFASRSGLRTFYDIESENFAHAMEVAIERYQLKAVALTRKKSRASRTLTLRSYALDTGGTLVDSDWRDLEVVDRLGGGDAFAGGFITGYLEKPDDLSWGVNLGSAASALKHTMPGDFLSATRAEIEAAINITEGGVLQR